MSDPESNGVPGGGSIPSKAASTCGMGVEGRRSPSPSPEHSRTRQARSAPPVGIYVPPARRTKILQEVPTERLSSEPSPSIKSRQRRPDRAVYVPRHRRSTDAEVGPTTQDPTESSSTRDSSRTTRGDDSRRSTRHERTGTPVDATSSRKESPLLIEEVQGKDSGSLRDPSSVEADLNRASDREGGGKDEEATATAGESIQEPRLANGGSTSTVEGPRVPNESNDANDSNLSRKTSTRQRDRTTVESLSNDSRIVLNNAKNSKDEASSSASRTADHRRRSEEDSSPGRESINGLEIGTGVLIVPSDTRERLPGHGTTLTTTVAPSEKKIKKVERQKSKPVPPPFPASKVNRDECDWDSLFDDNGDCLDPTLIEELTSTVGEVTIEQPKNDYKAYARPVEVSTDDFAHVVEIYDFPSDFKTSDLAAVFSPFRNGGFEFKWVDDTHCLGVFSSPLIAAEVLAIDHPFVKTRPLSEATASSKTKARRSAECLQPYRSRPETCAALARRLVTGALGVKLATARQEREREKLVLREAKEKKRLANQQRDDAWEGVIGEK
ncbi:coiled-coil domain-containing protein R3HCC1L isoform X2 [Orussus abietinus]|uniref:coiled-coil domain-containing protein R3HCC1L isoform X2 n=1 Tax=Orussus abietinus TaxID=222816 RepID=UPI00062512FB|nr:coiled-coil domain-containing protein R3HCC1L isoform X2 [Orussus abietinus]